MEEKQEFFEEDYENEPIQCRKHVAIVFILDMIVDNTNQSKTFSTTDIIERLDRYPYSLRIERRAVSDIINTLTAEYPYIHKDSTGRVWCDRMMYKKAA